MNLKLLSAPGPPEGVDISKEKIAFSDWPLTDATGDIERGGFNRLDSAADECGDHAADVYGEPAGDARLRKVERPRQVACVNSVILGGNGGVRHRGPGDIEPPI